MQCDYCQNPDVTLLLVPYGDDSHTWSCQKCLQDHGLFCEKHDCVHTRFGAFYPIPETAESQHACLQCIEDTVALHGLVANSVYSEIMGALDDDGKTALREYAEMVMMINGDRGLETPVLRAVMTSAARRGLFYEQVVAEVVKTKSLDEIIPQ